MVHTNKNYYYGYLNMYNHIYGIIMWYHVCIKVQILHVAYLIAYNTIVSHSALLFTTKGRIYNNKKSYLSRLWL